MNPFYYLTIFFSGLLALCYLVILFSKPSNRYKLYSKFILWLAYCLLSSIVAASFWSEYELSKEVKKLKELQSSISSRTLDNLSLSQDQKSQILDSLNIESEQLDAILNAVKRQNAIVGGSPKTIDEIYSAKMETQKQQNEIIKFNTIINSKKVANKKKGYRINSQSSSFTFLPPQDLSNDYVDLGLYFQDETILPKIAVICIEILKINEDGTLELVDDIYYEPQQGLNKFRLRNYFKDSNIYALVGFYWKDDFNSSEYPTYESIKFHPTK